MAESEAPGLVFRNTSFTMRDRFTPARACSTRTRMLANFRLVRFSAAVSSPWRGFFFQRFGTELRCRRFPIAPLKIGKQRRPLLLRARLPHDLAAVQRLSLAGRLAGTPIRQQVVHRKGSRMRRVGIQRRHQRRARLNQTDSRVATAVDPTLVALRQAEPTLQVEVIPDPLIVLLADEQAGQEAQHQRRHPVADRILGRLETIDQRLELLLPLGDVLRPGLQRRGHLRDHRDVLSDDLLLLLDLVQAALDASGQAAELLLRESPFFASRSRWSDAWTSFSASAIRNPGGCSGPP